MKMGVLLKKFVQKTGKNLDLLETNLLKEV